MMISLGTVPSMSRGNLSVLSMAFNTAASQAALPLGRVSFFPIIVPSGETRTETSAIGFSEAEMSG